MTTTPRTAPLHRAVAALPALALLLPADGILGQDRDRPAGYPITSPTVIENCASCHTRDSTGRMTRLSFLRKTPEGWQTSIRRMVTLNSVRLEPDAAREIVRYLANTQGLAPEELRPGLFEVERRLVDYTYAADEDTETACKQCHSLGRVILERRTREEWELLLATHRGYYPLADFQAFRRPGPPPSEPGPDGQPPDTRHPMEKAVAHLAATFPLETPEWAAWVATKRSPRIEGTWALRGHEPGSGPVFGRMTISRTAGTEDEFVTTTTYRRTRTGETVQRSGAALVYTGYQWRGRSTAASDPNTTHREVMTIERDWRTITGRWFTGAHDEFGLDVTLTRVTGEPIVSGVYPAAIRTGGRGQEVQIYGANLPSDSDQQSIDFGPGITVSEVMAATADVITVRLDVTPGATPGPRDLFVHGVHRPEAVTVFDRVDRIEVTPLAGMARVGGGNFPKQYQQFEAVGFHHGADGKPNTPDDLPLGPVEVRWTLEEYHATYDDDDLQFVGRLDDHGLFTPNIDGPNPERRRHRNNVGDVWVVATYDPSDNGDRPLRARAHLLVTVPLYMRWEPWRMER